MLKKNATRKKNSKNNNNNIILNNIIINNNIRFFAKTYKIFKKCESFFDAERSVIVQSFFHPPVKGTHARTAVTSGNK